MGSREVGGLLGRRIVLMILLGAVVPLGAIGIWATRSAARSGRALLGAQLDVQLEAVVADVETRWQQHRSDLLTLSENEPVRLQLREEPTQSREAPPFVARSFAQMAAFDRVVLKDRDGHTLWTLESAGLVPNAGGYQSASDTRLLAVRVPVTDLLAGDTLGVVEALVRVSSLVVPATRVATADGPLTAVFAHDGGSVIPPGADERLFSSERLEWSGHHWLTIRRTLSDPRIDIAMAGALDLYVRPFESSATRGSLALLASALAIGVLLIILTRRLTRDVERELAQREALAAVGEFASELAHEVRNPLTAIRLDLQRAEEAANEPAVVRRIVPKVLEQIERLDRSVTGALRVARGGSIERRQVDLRAVLEAAQHGARPEFSQRGARLSVDAGSSAPLSLDGDAGALEQLFLNLLLNAAQSLDRDGEARVTATRHDDAYDVVVADTGRGMTDDELARLDRPFRTTRRDGTGLGLKIARQIVASHRGSIDIKSIAGEGTTVRVRLPAR